MNNQLAATFPIDSFSDVENSPDQDVALSQSSESRVISTLRQVGYRVESIEFHLDNSHAQSGLEPRVMVTYVDRPLVGDRLEQIEQRAITETLKACGGNQAQAARQLGVSEKTIYNKLRQYRRRG